MNDMWAARLVEVLERIALALEEDGHMTPEQNDRMLAIQEESVALTKRKVEADELHNQLHLSGRAHQPPPS